MMKFLTTSSTTKFLPKKFVFSPILFTFLGFIILFLNSQDFRGFFGYLDRYGSYMHKHPGKRKESTLPFVVGELTDEGCDIFSGRWVRDEKNSPMYEESDCPYIQPQLTCQDHGRPEKDYQHWRWQPHACSLRRFNATLMLETLRGKRMIFVGDSLNRGQYMSFICLLHRTIPQEEKTMESSGLLKVFKAKEYNASIEFYWAPFLVESNADNAIVHRVTDRVVRKDYIIKHGDHWKGADIIIFNTFLWWMTGDTFNIIQGSFEDEIKEVVEVSTEDAYRMAIKSMLGWVESNMNPNETRVLFTGPSPIHENASDWGGDLEGSCYNETTLIEESNYWGPDVRKSIMQVLEEEFEKTNVPITFINITRLSSYRKDAHTSVYKKQWNRLTQEQLANPKSYADCIHWCLPGLQDTWNELLFNKLFYP